MECVLDCSLALAWALPDETSHRAERLLAQLSPKSTLWVPALWWYELANALLTAQPPFSIHTPWAGSTLSERTTAYPPTMRPTWMWHTAEISNSPPWTIP